MYLSYHTLQCSYLARKQEIFIVNINIINIFLYSYHKYISFMFIVNLSKQLVALY